MKITNLEKVKKTLLELAEETSKNFINDLADKREFLNDLKKSGDPTGIISEVIDFELLGKKRIPNLKNEGLISKELKGIFDYDSELLAKKFLCSPISFKTMNEIHQRTIDIELEYSTGNKYNKKVVFQTEIFSNFVEFNFLNIYGDLVWGFLNNEDTSNTDRLISETTNQMVELLMKRFEGHLDKIEKEKSLEELMAVVDPEMSDEDYINAVSEIDLFLNSELLNKSIVNKKVVLNFLKTAIEKDSSNLTNLKNISGKLLRVIKLPKMKRDMMDSVIKWYVNDEIKRGLFSPVDPGNNKIVLSFELDLLSKLLKGYLDKEKAEKLGQVIAKEFNRNQSSNLSSTFKIDEKDAKEIFSIDRGMRINKNDLSSILSQNKFVAKYFIEQFNEISNKKAVFESEDLKIISLSSDVDLSFYDKLIDLVRGNENFIINCNPDEKKNIKRSLERLMLAHYKDIDNETIEKILSSVKFDLVIFNI
mgnify:CR=1 FL=1